MKRILRRQSVEETTGLSYSTIYRKERNGEFPKRIQLGPNSVGWYADEIEEWVDSLHRARRSNAQASA
ncbi:MAG: AlpA family transcriptional regulator [Candidatus Thiodiazotropha taylori]|nr:AlpA family transcriptional regulator [Candidatus Thiodiazotropha taylori]MCW4327883.1 AlpA family transcriptional regulator [Candidatus Thiodiazotropha taylori]